MIYVSGKGWVAADGRVASESPTVVQAAATIREFAAKYVREPNWQVCGLMPVESSIGYYKAKWEDALRRLAEAEAELANLKEGLR